MRAPALLLRLPDALRHGLQRPCPLRVGEQGERVRAGNAGGRAERVAVGARRDRVGIGRPNQYAGAGGRQGAHHNGFRLVGVVRRWTFAVGDGVGLDGRGTGILGLRLASRRGTSASIARNSRAGGLAEYTPTPCLALYQPSAVVRPTTRGSSRSMPDGVAIEWVA